MSVYDGMLTGAADDPGGELTLHEVFDPPWWRLDRWARWWVGGYGAKRHVLWVGQKRLRARPVKRP